MKKIQNCLLIALMLLSSGIMAQITIDGEFRPRLLIDNGYKTIRLKSDQPLVYLSQRSRVNFGYKNEKLETYFSLQDVHFWGDDDLYSSSGVSGNTKGILLHQAWFALKPSSSMAIKIGRQQFSFDDQRILSARNWNDYQVTYDAVLLSWVKSKSKIDLAASWNANGSADVLYPKGKMKLLDFLRFEQQLNNISLSGIALVSGFTKADTIPDIALTGTYGVNAQYKVPGFDARITGYYQNNLNNVSGKVDAWCFSLFARKLFFNDNLSIGAGLDLYSGNDGTISDAAYKSVQHKFNSLYGNRHGVLGFMDYYTSIPEQGIQDYMLKADYKLSKDMNLLADFHLFYLNNNGYDLVTADQMANKNLGSEIDLTLQWKVMKDVNLQAGYSFYGKTDTIEKLKKVYNKETHIPQFAYIMVTVKPTFYKTEK